MMHRNQFNDNGLERQRKKKLLWRQLEQTGYMWSYAKNPSRIDDALLVEKAFFERPLFQQTRQLFVA